MLSRLTRAEEGNLRDTKPVGESVSEMRIDYGPGCRIYFKKRRKAIIVLLVGGDKSSQEQDVERAIQLARVLEE